MNSYPTLKCLVMAIMLLPATAVANSEGLSGHISGFIGLKTMDGDDWPDLDKHFSMGAIFDVKKDSWPVSISLDISDTGDKHKHDGMEDLGHTTEYHLGVRKIFTNQNRNIQPYVGGGVSIIYAEQEFEENNNTTTQDDDAVGAWFGAGMYYEINPSFVLGLDVRYSEGEVTLIDEDIDAGGFHTGITGGYQF